MNSLILVAAVVLGVDGVVVDSSQRPVGGAVVGIESVEGARYRTTTDAAGRFVFPAAGGAHLRLTVAAPGYTDVEKTLAPDERTLTIVLTPLHVAGEITVTATRHPARLGETAADVVILSRDDLREAAAPALDDVLRQIPGFTLFRRSGSRVANPTAQGVSLRGVGASGASRALVLDDGVPLNDPFGGWIYWGRVPRALIGRIEVLRGGGADLYGSSAFGGVVNLIRRDEERAFTIEGSFGSQETAEASVYYSETLGEWRFRASAETFSTGGYVLVDSDERGRIDTPADSERTALDATIARGAVFLRASFYEEDRSNGTPGQVNDTEIIQWSGGGDWTLAANWVSARLYASRQDYNQTFTAVAEDRASERLTRVQRVPSDSFGMSTQWSRAVGSTHWLVGGVELREVEGESDEEVHAATISRVRSGGGQRLAGLYFEDVLAISPRFSATLGARYDSRQGFDEAVSPRVSLVYRAGSGLSLVGSAYRAFRAPTLNELHRAFRVGNILTLANEELKAERLTGVEGGIRVERPALAARLVLFSMRVSDPIANVTLSVTPSLITRQRQNLGETRSRGIELEVDGRWRRFRLSAGYLLADAVVLDFSVNPALEGKALAQVPEHQITAQAAYAHERGSIALQSRWIGEQFDDDQNQFPLEDFSTVDLFASQRLARALQAFVAIENAFDVAYEVGRTPITTLGSPRTFRVGVRFGD